MCADWKRSFPEAQPAGPAVAGEEEDAEAAEVEAPFIPAVECSASTIRILHRRKHSSHLPTTLAAEHFSTRTTSSRLLRECSRTHRSTTCWGTSVRTSSATVVIVESPSG